MTWPLDISDLSTEEGLILILFVDATVVRSTDRNFRFEFRQ